MAHRLAGLVLAAALTAGACGCGMIEDMQYVRAERAAHEQPRVSGLTVPTVPPPSSANPALLDPPGQSN